HLDRSGSKPLSATRILGAKWRDREDASVNHAALGSSSLTLSRHLLTLQLCWTSEKNRPPVLVRIPCSSNVRRHILGIPPLRARGPFSRDRFLRRCGRDDGRKGSLPNQQPGTYTPFIYLHGRPLYQKPGPLQALTSSIQYPASKLALDRREVPDD